MDLLQTRMPIIDGNIVLLFCILSEAKDLLVLQWWLFIYFFFFFFLDTLLGTLNFV